MGTEFFKRSSSLKINPTAGVSIPVRAMGANEFAAHAEKDIGAAMGINKAGVHKPIARSGIYGKGPKV